MPILDALGWPTSQTQVVCPEYTVEGKRVDFALCRLPRRPDVFIEVKQIGQGEGADRQLFEYAFHVGVPMAILTTGQEWHFYLPAEKGNYQDRRVYKLDMLERETEECANRLTRYLSYDRVADGKSIEAAREDYKSIERRREIEGTLPTAWLRLLEEQDELLTELIANKVEELCGYRPDPDAVAGFPKAQTQSPSGPQEPHDGRRQLRPTPARPTSPLPPDATQMGYVLDGQKIPTRSARDVLTDVLERFSSRDPGFLERFAARPKHGRTRRFVARTADELYPGRPDLARDHSHQLSSGWWIGVNYSKRNIKDILQMACEVAGLQFGTDLVVYLG